MKFEIYCCNKCSHTIFNQPLNQTLFLLYTEKNLKNQAIDKPEQTIKKRQDLIDKMIFKNRKIPKSN